MAPYFIRKYQESDHQWVVGLLSQGKAENITATSCHALKSPQTLVLLLGGHFAVLLVSESWLPALMFCLAFLLVLWFLARHHWRNYERLALGTDMVDITTLYLSKPGFSLWVAESEKKVVGMIGALPVHDFTCEKQELYMARLYVDSEHRCQGVAKALVRTLFQFA
ncbi:N-acetyltransferase 8-like [Nycticebus coucang]|uniref:N-acetyltransferase 8-like n=1 Tax=Nycticebus coucang TaxID=9470 RepID=UPI00234DCCAC|nr:N-acetyltransferase 8-like [Nycticebus coucang]XP_053444300.1 N-acetyltransferase 8-like [Nycticebus coucang]